MHSNSNNSHNKNNYYYTKCKNNNSSSNSNEEEKLTGSCERERTYLQHVHYLHDILGEGSIVPVIYVIVVLFDIVPSKDTKIIY